MNSNCELQMIDVEKLKEIQLNILDAINDFCHKNSITYYLFAGSLIGAVRHGGYIPWDDDLDICMKRDDYNKFFDDFNKNQQGRYKAISIANCSNYYLATGKVIDTTTVMRERSNLAMEIGVYVDIFPLDNLPTDFQEIKKLDKKISVYRNLLILKSVEISRERAFYKNAILMVAQIFTKFISTKYIINKISEKAQTYNNDKECENIGDISVFTYGFNEVLLKKDFDNTIKLVFEGRKYDVPVGYDNVLSTLYGDYMKLPPENKRISHHAFEAYFKE